MEGSKGIHNITTCYHVDTEYNYALGLYYWSITCTLVTMV